MIDTLIVVGLANGEWTRIVNAAAESVCEQCAATPDPGDPRKP